MNFNTNNLDLVLICSITVDTLEDKNMGEANTFIAAIALSMGAAWASGINLYAAILTLGLMSLGGYIQLPESLLLVEDPWVLGAAGIMFCVEFFADKIPGLDSTWDAIHTFIRIPAGAILAAGAIGTVHPGLMVAAFLVGGGVSAATHAAKASTRLAVNTSPEPVSNWFLSIAEDFSVIVGIWAAVAHPWVFLVLFILFILLLIWLLPKLWRFTKKVLTSLGRFFGIIKREEDTPSLKDNANTSQNNKEE